MSVERTVLLVFPTSALSNTVAPSLRRSGFCLMIARTYQSAKLQLAQVPQVLVTELKLGEYNGLQLALRSHRAGVRAIVVAEKAFEAEIDQLGATWMSPEDAASGELPALIARLLATPLAAASAWYDTPQQNTEGDGEAPASYASVIH